MNAQSPKLHSEPSELTAQQQLLKRAATRLEGFAISLHPLQAALDCVAELGDLAAQKAAGRLARQLVRFEPTVTMIGQIKSGKTTLVNSMIGQPGLLPADVNPWTSVVTSLHLCPQALTPPTSAKFRFFENGEWDRLVTGGGRIGELANRAGADDEFSAIKKQVEEMREKSKRRLGRKFEMLLGQEHSYGYFDQELIERYVCLGDDFENDATTSKSQGRFADITKSADLRMHQPALPTNLCLRDTPGVNDTFMMREQITIKAIRESRICVVVLSAHQALSSTDLALIRLISNVKSREVIIFVNRIDELSDPAKQVPQIKDSIRQTLQDHKGPQDAQLIFGSALWAQNACQGSINSLPDASKEALMNWAEVAEITAGKDTHPHHLMWDLSGLPTLYAAISDRIIEGEGAEVFTSVAAATANLINAIMVSDNITAKANVGQATVRLPHGEIAAALSEIQSRATSELRFQLDDLTAKFKDRVERAHHSFLTRATEALAKHLEVYGEQSAWAYDPAGLRILLGSAHKIFGTKCASAFDKVATQAVLDLQGIYRRALDLPPDLYAPKRPDAPRIPPPVSLGQTIALDLQGRWWKSWWNRRKSYLAQAQGFHDLIKAETDTLVHDLTGDQAAMIRAEMLSRFEGFLNAEVATLSHITKRQNVASGEIDKLFGVQELRARDARLNAASEALERYIA